MIMPLRSQVWGEGEGRDDRALCLRFPACIEQLKGGGSEVKAHDARKGDAARDGHHKGRPEPANGEDQRQEATHRGDRRRYDVAR